MELDRGSTQNSEGQVLVLLEEGGTRANTMSGLLRQHWMSSGRSAGALECADAGRMEESLGRRTREACLPLITIGVCSIGVCGRETDAVVDEDNDEDATSFVCTCGSALAVLRRGIFVTGASAAAAPPDACSY